MFKNKNVLVSGGAGVIGKELVKLLLERGANVRVVDMVEKPPGLDDVSYFQMDLSKNPQFLFRFDPDYVFHLAADFERSEETEEFWDSNFMNNVLASHHFLKQVCRKASLKKIIFASSYLIYDKSLYHIESDDVCDLAEDATTDPRNLTGIAKLQTECDIDFLSKGGNRFKYASARIFRVYGRGSRDIISRWIRDILRGRTISVFDEKNSFDYIFSRDVAEGLMRLCESDAQGIYNLGRGESKEIKDVVQVVRDELGEFNTKVTEDSIFKERSRADITRLKDITGWSPAVTLRQGIREIISYEKKLLENERRPL